MPFASVAITVNVCGPAVAVSIGAPFGTVPTHEAIVASALLHLYEPAAPSLVPGCPFE